jgi:long-chain fatty acid transport protein
MLLSSFCNRACRVLALLAWLAWLSSSRAAASPLFETYGASNTLGGFNARVSSPSAASAYFNPALLPRAPRGIVLGTFFGYDAISIDLGRRSARNDLSEVGAGKYRGGDQIALPTSWIEDGCDPATGGQCISKLRARRRQAHGSSHQLRPYATVGLVTPLFGKYLTAGLYTVLPLKVFTRASTFYVDEREQYFSNSLHPELYSDRLEAISLATALGSQLTDALAIGLSLSIGMVNHAVGSTYVADSNDFDESLRISTELSVKLRLEPHAAIAYTPSPAWSLSATLHSPQKFEVVTRPSTTLPVGQAQQATRRAVHDWLPWRAALGLHWDFLRSTRSVWGVTGNAMFARWSRYENRHGERPRVDFEWRDTVAGSLGLRHTLRARLHSLLDVSYVPSPVPLQSGRDNYVDNDRAVVQLGSEYELPKLGEATLKLGLSAQLHWLRPRTQHKLDPTKLPPDYPQLVVDEWADDQADSITGEVYTEAKGLQTNNPGWPGFGSRGLLAALSFTISVLY